MEPFLHWELDDIIFQPPPPPKKNEANKLDVETRPDLGDIFREWPQVFFLSFSRFPAQRFLFSMRLERTKHQQNRKFLGSAISRCRNDKKEKRERERERERERKDSGSAV